METSGTQLVSKFLPIAFCLALDPLSTDSNELDVITPQVDSRRHLLCSLHGNGLCPKTRTLDQSHMFIPPSSNANDRSSPCPGRGNEHEHGARHQGNVGSPIHPSETTRRLLRGSGRRSESTRGQFCRTCINKEPHRASGPASLDPGRQMDDRATKTNRGRSSSARRSDTATHSGRKDT